MIIKEVFLDQLPSSCRVTLTLSEIKNLEKITEMVERFMEASGIGESCSSVSFSANNNLEELIGKIDALSLSFEATNKANNQGLFNKKIVLKLRIKINRSFQVLARGYVFYYKKFGNSAYKCIKPLSWRN